MHSKVITYIICILMFTTFFYPNISNDVNIQISEESEAKHDGSGNYDGIIYAQSSNLNGDVYKTDLGSSGISGLADSPWPMFSYNAQRTGLSPHNTSKNNGQLKWSFLAGGDVKSPVIGPDEIIYVGSSDGKLYAINPNGTEKWHFTAGGYVGQSPAIGYDKTIYFGSRDNKLYALNLDGTEKWNFTTNERVNYSPAIDSDSTIYVPTQDGTMYAISPNGSEKWRFIVKAGYVGTPGIATDGTIYFGDSESTFYAVNPNGTEKWNFLANDHIANAPAIGPNGTIYAGSRDHNLYAINPNGTEKWRFSTGHPIGYHSSAAISSDGTIYFGSNDQNLYALNPDGKEKWRFPANSLIQTAPAIGSEGTIYFGSDDFNLYAITPDGTEKWNYTTGFLVHSSPAIGSDGTIYIGSFDRKLYAIGTPDIPPIAIANPDRIVNERDAVQFNGSASYDSDGSIVTYEWDFDQSDSLWWETGTEPDATGIIASHTYGDDGVFVATLRVTDNDNLSAIDICNITVLNVDPTVSIESVSMEVEIGLRVAGRKYNNVSMTLYEDGDSLGSVSIERLPGSPNIQMAWIPVSIHFSKSYSANVTFTPEDPPNVGANPVWIYIKSENGTINKIHHTFNVQQSKKRNSEHWNHVEPWEVELNPHFIGLDFEITSHIIDPGSDDETLTYTYESQTVIVTKLINPPNPDPYPSPEVNPRDIMDTTTLIYEGPGTITLVVKDDDNIRLGIGQGSDSFDI